MKHVILICFFLTITPILAMGKVITYNYPAGIPLTGDYRVTVDGVPQPVLLSPIPASYSTFGMEGEVNVEIQAWQDIKWVDIRPASAGIKTKVKEGVVSFTLTEPCQLSIEFNGKLFKPLFLFANPPEEKPSRSDKNIIYFEAGKRHKPGTITPKSGQHIFIEGGAWVEGTISAQDVENVTISGFGIMDGSNNLKLNDDNSIHKYNRFIEFYNSKNIHIEGPILYNSTTWQVVPINCDDVTIHNIKILSDNPSDDGIDIVRSRSVHVNNCFIRTRDDCIAIKAFMNYADDCIVDNVLIEKCTIWNGKYGNGLEIGFELHSSEVKNITFSDIDMIHVESGAVFSIHNSDKAKVKNVLYDNIRIEDPGDKLFDLAIFRSKYCTDGSLDDEYLKANTVYGIWDNVLKVPADKKQEHAKYRGHIEDIHFRNIKITDGHHPYSLFVGYDDDHLVKRITIDNLQINGRHISALKDLKLHTEYARDIIIK